MQETWVWHLGLEDTLEKRMATHSSIAWRILWTEEPGGLQSMGSQRGGHDVPDVVEGTHALKLKKNLCLKLYIPLNCCMTLGKLLT